MFDTPDYKVRSLLNKVATSELVTIDDSIVQEFGERCKKTLVDLLTPREDKFTLRMSNIGYDARHLWLQKEYGRGELPSPEFLLKMTYGHIAEHIMLSLLKVAGVDVEENNGKVSLDVHGQIINGEFDAKIAGMHYDFKTASPYSFEHKFVNVDKIKQEDSFGYIHQAIGYSLADDTPFGGWYVINLVSGEFKIIDGTVLNNKEEQGKFYKHTRYVMDVLDGSEPAPPCTGVEEETFYKKPTGNHVLGRKCSYCPHKNKCHPDVKYMPSQVGKAKEPTWKYYVKLNQQVNTLELEEEETHNGSE